MGKSRFHTDFIIEIGVKSRSFELSRLKSDIMNVELVKSNITNVKLVKKRFTNVDSV